MSCLDRAGGPCYCAAGHAALSRPGPPDSELSNDPYPLSILLLSEQDVRGLPFARTDRRADRAGLSSRRRRARPRFRPRSASIRSAPTRFLHAMPAWVGGPTRALGMKWVSYFPGNFDRGLPDSTGIIILNDPDLGLPVASWKGCTSLSSAPPLAPRSLPSISRAAAPRWA